MKRKLISVFLTICLIMPFASASDISFAKSGDTITGNPVSIYDDVTKCTYNYINFNGGELLRPYMGMQSWTTDGKSFVCGVRGETMDTGTIYLYNTETNEFTEVGTGLVYTTHIEAVIGTDDCVYYSSNNNIFKYDIKTKETAVVLPATMGFDPISMTISNDCQYISFSSGINKDYWCDEGETAIFRYNIPKREIECLTHKFNYSNFMTHQQINPADPDIVFFAHEAVIGDGEGQVPNYWSIYDREWSADFKTGEIKNMFKQGKTDSDTSILFTTHESWSASGKYLYINCYTNANANGKGDCIIRCYPDGSHREFLKNTHSNPKLSVDHAMASGDDKFTVVDSNGGRYVYVLSNDTYEQFPIYYSATGHMEIDEDGNATSVSKGHPYHPHPNVARNHYKVDWGIEHEGVVGIAWYDFTEIANSVAEGGRYAVSDTIDRVSYTGLDCETSEKTYADKNCLYAATEKYLYFDISEDVVDCTNSKITVSFDYYDNSTNNIVLTYTDGIVTDNDYADSEDASITIKRNGTNAWKTYTTTIESGNFENINPYRTDFKIGGGDVYIANIAVSDAEDKTYAGGDGTKNDPYRISNADQLRYFAEQVKTTDVKTEVDSLSYIAKRRPLIGNATDDTYNQKRYHVFSDTYFELTEDIDLENKEWTPIGDLVNTFNGHFNGNGHVISNVLVDATSPQLWERAGFFGATGADVVIENLGLENVEVEFAPVECTTTVRVGWYSYTYSDKLIGGAGFVSTYAGGTFTNCYIKNVTVKNTSEGTASGGTGAFFGVGYGTKKATEENGYNKMTVTNCYVNGATICAGSHSYGFIGPDVDPISTETLSETNDYRVTKTIKNCYTANVKRGYYSGNPSANDGTMYPFASTTINITCNNCYTTSSGETTTSGAATVVSDSVLKTTDKDTLNNGLVDNINYYNDVKEINDGYPIHTDMSDPIIWDGITDKKPAGKGEEDDPYLISTKEELVWFKNSVNIESDEGKLNGYTSEAGSHFKLISDIDLEGNEWEPVGNTKVAFKGHFDGNGHVIKNFKIRSFEENYIEASATADATEKSKFCTDKIYKYIGFFGRTTKGAVVSNLGIENAKINFWNHDYYYELKVDELGVVTDKNMIRAAETGGMVGYAYGGEFINCYVKNSEIKNMNRGIRDSGVAGFAGLASWDASFIGCYVKNAVLSSSIYTTISGFSNNIANSITCTDCYVSNVIEDRPSYFSTSSTAYGFGKGDASAKITQCYSEMTDFASTANGVEAYNSNKSLGIVSTAAAPVTKEDINSIATYENLAPDNFDGNVNDGYPICLWQMSSKAKQKYDADTFDITDAITADLPITIGKFGSAVTWTTSDATIIDKNGSVTFYSEPKTATVQATTADGYNTKSFDVTVEGKVPFEKYSFNVTKDGVDTSEFVSGGTINKVSFYKNITAENCYMYTVLYDKTDGNRMIGCSIDFIDDIKLSAKETHTIDLSTLITLPNDDTSKYVLKLIFVSDETTFKPICDNFKYYE